MWMPISVERLKASLHQQALLGLDVNYDSAASFKAKPYEECYFVNL